MTAILSSIHSVTAFAPASSANFAVGYDIIGFAVQGVGDRVTLVKRDDSALVIKAIDGVPGAEKIPLDPHKNVCTAVISKMLADLELQAGFDMTIHKGVPLSSGMGGSAASAVAAVIALNRFLEVSLSTTALTDYAIYAESLISGGVAHGDNAVPCLQGGLILLQSSSPCRAIGLPAPDVRMVIVHPDIEVETAEARKLLQQPFAIRDIVAQTGNLAALISALYTHDIALMGTCMRDSLVEPRRAPYIDGFSPVQQAAFDAGALACSISGSGPSLFAMAWNETDAEEIAHAMVEAFGACGHHAEAWVSPLNAPGAVVEDVQETS